MPLNRNLHQNNLLSHINKTFRVKKYVELRNNDFKDNSFIQNFPKNNVQKFDWSCRYWFLINYSVFSQKYQ